MKVWRLVLPLVLVIALPGMALPGDTKAKDEIVRLENRWLASVDNPDALESILADDFVHVFPSGIITKQEQLDYQRKHPPTDHPKRSFDGMSVRVYGDVAIANGAVLAVDGHGGKRKTYFTDVFVKRNGQWQAVNAQEDAETTSAAEKH